MGQFQKMFKTLIKHYIYETCIDILMSNIKNNFAQKPEEKPRDMYELWGSRLYISNEIERVNRICDNKFAVRNIDAIRH